MREARVTGTFRERSIFQKNLHTVTERSWSMWKGLGYVGMVALGVLVGLGCDSTEQQGAYEEQAFAVPSGVTQTDRYGEIISEDQDDWRTAPAYRSRVLIDPAFPNPASVGTPVAIPVRVVEFNAVQGGLELVSFDDNRIARRLADIRDARNPGAYVFKFNPVSLGVTGLVRVYIVDNLGGLVSYGDVQIEQ